MAYKLLNELTKLIETVNSDFLVPKIMYEQINMMFICSYINMKGL